MTENDFTKPAFEHFLREHKLMGARCKSCGMVHLPPRSLCSSCRSSEMEWVELDGEGKLVAFTTIHIAPTAMIEAGYGRDNPYVSGIVKLNDGPSISAQILGVDVLNPSEIKIGAPLKIEFIDLLVGEETKTSLAFKQV